MIVQEPGPVLDKYLAEHLKITCKSTLITNSNSQVDPQLPSTVVLLASSFDLAAFFYLRLSCKKQRNATEPCWHQRNLHFYCHLDLGNLALSHVCLHTTPHHPFAMYYTPKLLQTQTLQLRVYMSPEKQTNKKSIAHLLLSQLISC